MTTPEQPGRLYLDVDGVLLARGSEFADTTEWAFGVYSEEVIRRIGAIGLERVWLTTWQDQIGQLESRCGLVAANYLVRGKDFQFGSDYQQYRNGKIAWKYQALIEDQEAQSSPFVWVDDHMTRAVVEDANERFADREHEIIVPNRSVGLRERDLARIEKFAGQLLTN